MSLKGKADDTGKGIEMLSTQAMEARRHGVKTMFGIIAGDVLYLKVDDTNRCDSVKLMLAGARTSAPRLRGSTRRSTGRATR